MQAGHAVPDRGGQREGVVGRHFADPQGIQALVADYYNVTLDDMKGKRRDKHIVFPRQVAMFLVREETPSSLPAIGKAFGGRDHTTALHSIEKIANELKEDERLRYEVQAIRERLYVQ